MTQRKSPLEKLYHVLPKETQVKWALHKCEWDWSYNFIVDEYWNIREQLWAEYWRIE